MKRQEVGSSLPRTWCRMPGPRVLPQHPLGQLLQVHFLHLENGLSFLDFGRNQLLTHKLPGTVCGTW